MENKEHLLRTTKIKLIILALSTILPILLFLLFEIPSFMEKFVVYNDLVVLRYFIAILLEGYIGVKIYSYIKILKNEEYAKYVIVKKNDERNNYIRLRASTTSIKIFIYALGIGAIVSGFINSFMFYSILGCLVALLMIYISVYVYFHKKY